MSRLWMAALPLAALAFLPAREPGLPNRPESVKLAIIGDSGTGGRAQAEVAARMVEARGRFPFGSVLMLGDNLYGNQTPSDYRAKFEKPYQPLLAAGVKFHASLGNHDEPAQRNYREFNMGGKRYYSFILGNAEFFALDTTLMDGPQVEWLRGALAQSKSPWKIAFFHHPIYSSGTRHGSDLTLRGALEPLFMKHGVGMVFSGHDHFYERLVPQKGVAYFICGGSAKLRKRNIAKTGMTAKGFDTDNSFMLLEIGDAEAYFQTISRAGKIVDAGVVTRAAFKSAASGQ